MRTLDYQQVSQKISQWIKANVRQSGVEGIVVGMSGGIDSSVSATLAANVLGEDTVLGLLMPEDFTPKQDTDDAGKLADWLQIKTKQIPIANIVKAFPFYDPSKLSLGNLRARVRMSLLYLYANEMNRLVLGTGDLSEHLLGYFTKHGDGGTDLEPIGGLFKTEVRQLGKYLGIRSRIINKPSSPHLYPNHLATQELPADYDILDPFLYEYYILGLRWELNDWQTRTVAMFDRSRHKRALPPGPEL